MPCFTLTKTYSQKLLVLLRRTSYLKTLSSFPCRPSGRVLRLCKRIDASVPLSSFGHRRVSSLLSGSLISLPFRGRLRWRNVVRVSSSTTTSCAGLCRPSGCITEQYGCHLSHRFRLLPQPQILLVSMFYFARFRRACGLHCNAGCLWRSGARRKALRWSVARTSEWSGQITWY